MSQEYKDEIRKDAILKKILNDGATRWKDIWEYLNNKELIETEFYIVRSDKTDLSRCLNEMINDGIIRRIKHSHKNVEYILTEDMERLSITEHSINSFFEGHRNILKNINTEEFAKIADFAIKQLFLKWMEEYLKALMTIPIVRKHDQQYIRWRVRHFTDYFLELIFKCGQVYNKQTIEASNFIINILDEQIEKLTPKIEI